MSRWWQRLTQPHCWEPADTWPVEYLLLLLRSTEHTTVHARLISVSHWHGRRRVLPDRWLSSVTECLLTKVSAWSTHSVFLIHMYKHMTEDGCCRSDGSCLSQSAVLPECQPGLHILYSSSTCTNTWQKTVLHDRWLLSVTECLLTKVSAWSTHSLYLIHVQHMTASTAAAQHLNTDSI